MALFLLVALSSYARPSELLRAKVYSLVWPANGITRTWSLLLAPEEEGLPTKTGDFNVSILLDSPWMASWADGLFDSLKRCHPTSPLWDFGYKDYNSMFQSLSNHFGIQVTPYQTRHSGPSIDRSRRYRWFVTKRAPGWQALEKSFRGSSRPTPSSASEALGSTCRS